MHSILLSLALLTTYSYCQAGQVVKDITYAVVNGKALKLDLYLPEGIDHPSLLVWVHGGAWQFGNKDKVPMAFVENGFATASLDFRQATEAPFPANVYDIKAAIRFLRAKAADYGYRTDKIAIGGDSSGGHLAALIGVTNNEKDLEGSEGEFPEQSSSVQAILDYYGASDLMTILRQSTPHGLSVREPALKLLLGALPDDVPDLAKQASPVAHVDEHDPPLFLLHGDQDPQMPVNQALELEGVYQSKNLDVFLDVVHGGFHGGSQFYEGEHLKLALAFLHRTID